MSDRMKILVGYDGSESSAAALDDLRLAGLPQSSEVLVITVADVFVPPKITEAGEVFPTHVPQGVKLAQERAESKVAKAETIATKAAERLKQNFPAWNVNHEAFADSPAWALIRKAEERKSDLIVVSAHGHSVLGGRLILGSVSQRVLYEASCSVRISRVSQRENGAPLRILIGVDNSGHSNAAVETVNRRNWATGTEVRLLAVVDTVMAASASEPGEMKWMEVGDDNNWEHVRQIFEPSAAKLRAAGLDASVMIRRGHPTEELLDEAESWKADCIFVGAKGVRGIDRLLLGSVSSAVAAKAHCSVEVVRP